ncbi:MAG: 16S rRNA (cytosine(967)-C(5))-methyltransferase RsmB [Clostridia bacterium]|nr:16S rRNA (cytosine(967)-C(5))-methyltransferase RsmB [Clostridia bacterium]
MSDKTTDPRALAHSSLMAIMKQGRYSNIEIDTALKKAEGLSPADRGLYTRLVYGVIERRITLDHIIAQYSSRKLKDIDPPALTSLRLGFYQLLYTDRIPDFAAVSATVGTAPSRARGFVNATLRSFLRADKKYTLPTDDTPEAMSVAYSASPDICRVLIESYGAECTRQILESFFRTERVCLRVNTLKTTTEEVLNTLEDAAPGNYTNTTVCVPAVSQAVRDGIDAGLWFVQDEASRICTRVLDAKAGDVIADTCSAPGGKSFSAAIDGEGKAVIHSFDLHANKLSLINATAKKLGLSCITTEERDARAPKAELAWKCDKVLCDAPCSGFGVLAKKPDIRYKDGDSVGKLPEVQYAVLCGASEYVKAGGLLVYSTCTLNKRENEEVVRRFLETNADFSAVDFRIPALNKAYPDLNSEGGMLTLMPQTAGTDGFFIAKMVRKA